MPGVESGYVLTQRTFRFLGHWTLWCECCDLQSSARLLLCNGSPSLQAEDPHSAACTPTKRRMSIIIQVCDHKLTKNGARVKKRRDERYPWVRGSSHCVVFVLWLTKYTRSFESTRLSEGWMRRGKNDATNTRHILLTIDYRVQQSPRLNES